MQSVSTVCPSIQVLAAASVGLVYVVVSSYQYLRDTADEMDHPENLMLAPARMSIRGSGTGQWHGAVARGSIHGTTLVSVLWLQPLDTYGRSPLIHTIAAP